MLNSKNMSGLLVIKNKKIYCNWRKRLKDENNIEKLMKELKMEEYHDRHNPNFAMDEARYKNKEQGFYKLKTKDINCNTYTKLIKNELVFKRELLNNKRWKINFV